MRRGRAQLAAMVAAAGAAAAATAQPFWATLAFEASTDGGTTWRGGLVELSPEPASIQMRIRADWEVAAGYAFAYSQFDVVVENAAAGDSAADFVRPVPFNLNNQTIVASRFGSTIKIDDSRDTLPPDLGTRGVLASQGIEDLEPFFDRSRPVTIFSFTLSVDGTAGERSVSGHILRHPIEVRLVRIYRSPSGSINVAHGTVVPLTVRVVPGPGAAAFGMALVLLAGRRGRRT